MKSIDYVDLNMFSPKTAWDKLSLAEKSDVIRAGLDSGYDRMSDIKKGYNEFAEGGEKDILEKVNVSDADFVQRLKDPDRQAVRDWETGGIATHKLSVGTDNDGNHYIYPEVQRIDGKLVDFTRPPYDKYAGRKSAEQRGDTVRVPSLDDAIRFTQNYKQYYPKGNTFEIGGPKKIKAAPIDSAFMATRPSPWDIAARAALNYSSTVFGHEFPTTVKEPPIQPVPINTDEVRQRQAFMETAFNDKAVSPMGAKGRWQIMPNTLAEYTKATGKTGDLTDPDFNGEVRDWYLDKLLSRNWVTKGDASDSIQWGKALAAYNYGPTNTVNALNKAKTSGADIYGSWAWLDYMPEETRNYVNFILRSKDVNKHKNQVEYNKAVKKLNKKEAGGPLGGPDNLYADTYYNDGRIGLDGISLDDYLQAKRDSVIAGALDKSRTRTMPEKIDIQIPITDDERDQLPFVINQYEQELKAMNHIAGSPYLGNSDPYSTQNYPYTSTYNSRHSGRYKDYANEIDENSEAEDVDYYQDYLAWYHNSGPIELAVNKRYTEEALQDAKNVLRQGYRLGPGFTCLNTATNNYGREHQESSNVAFADNPNKYGFIEVNYNDKQPGDIVQINKESVDGLVPTHAILFNGLDEDGIATFNYSNGGNDQRSYRTNRRYPDDELENAKAYRFVGNPQDIEEWTQEYYNTHSLGGPLVQQANTYEVGGLMLGPINPLITPLISFASAVDARKSQKEERRKQDAVNNDFTDSEIKPLPFEDMIAKNIEKVDVKGMQQAGIEDYLRGLNTEQLKAVQREIADSGGYDKELRGNKEYIKKVQRELIESGYLDNSLRKDGSYREVDGIVGIKTQTAYNKYIGDLNVDGKLGPKTINGYLEMVSPTKQWKRDVSTSGVDGCAQWVTMKYEDAVGLLSLQNGVIGDAWQMPMNIGSKGGEILYNIYDDDFNNVKTPKDLKVLTEQKLKENPLDYSKIKVGDVVGIYIPSSNMMSTAIKEGTTKNTHVGIVTGFDKDGIPIVEHNIHGSHRHDKISNLTGSVTGQARVTVVARPKNTGSPVGEIPIKEKESRFKLADEYNNKNMTSYMNAMEGVSDIVQTLYPDVDINEAMIAAIAPLKRETNFMNNTVENLGMVDQLKKKAGNVVRKMKGMTDSTKSSNLTKMKLNSLTDSERRLLGIKTPKDLEDPKKAGAAALLLAARHLDYFNKLANTYPELGITEEDIFNATILAYNQGMSKLRSIGFDASGAKPEELEQLRMLSDPNTRIKDVNSTNYKYLGILGDMLYDRFGSSYTPYVGAAHDAIDKYIKPRQDGLLASNN